MLVAIDDRLRKRGIPIPLRPLAALAEVSADISRKLLLTDPIADEIQNWYDAKYGDRSRGLTSLGSVPVIISGETYRARIIPTFKTSRGDLAPNYDWVVEAGSGFDLELTDPESAEIRDMLDTAFFCFSELNDCFAERELPAHATDELEIAIAHLVDASGPKPGLSAWASQQVAEKSFKAFLTRRSLLAPFTHDLADLSRRCAAAGLGDVGSKKFRGKQMLEYVQFPAAVRYGEVELQVEEAIDAFYAALIIATAVAVKLRVEAKGKSWLQLVPTDSAIFVAKRYAVKAGVPQEEKRPRPK